MKKYKEYYLDINSQFDKIIGETLNEKNIMIHARLSNFIDDYLKWTISKHHPIRLFDVLAVLNPAVLQPPKHSIST